MFFCEKILANGSMKPTKLKEHLASVHPQHASDSLEVFQIKKDNLAIISILHFRNQKYGYATLFLNTIYDLDLIKDELIDLRSKEMALHDFQTKNLIEFWCSLTMAYPRAVSRAMKFLILFATTYLCESGFSTIITIKTKSRNRLDIKDDMRVALSNTVPDFKAILQSKQQQMSH